MGKFYHGEIELNIPEGVYYPREDSLLMARALETFQLKGKSALEIGCGSGFLSIIMAKAGAIVTAVDINEEAVEVANRNAGNNRVSMEAFRSDLFSKVKNKYDLIVFNPPYLPVEEGENDNTYAGGLSGRETIERFAGKVKDHLNLGGQILIVISSLTGEKETADLFQKYGMKTSTVAREKVPWEELLTIRIWL